jgi:uncharacterized membrane protein YdjX (TVP38/TMEM64 family)
MKRKLITLSVLVVTAGVCWVLLREHLTLEELARHEHRLRSALAEHRFAGLAAGLLVYSLVSLIPGTTGKSLVIGWLFGLLQGVLLVNIGLTVAAIASFLLSRYLLRDVLQSKFPVRLQLLDRAIERDGAFYVFALRMLHAPYTVTNYVMGATCISTRSFWWSTQSGMLPGNIVFVYAGTQLPTLSQAAEEGLSGVFSLELIAAFTLVGIFPLIVKWIMHRVWKRKVPVSQI